MRKAVLTEQQYGMWLEWKLAPNTAAGSNTAIYCALEGELDVSHLRNVCQMITDGFDSFRLNIIEEDGVPYQCYQEYVDANMLVYNVPESKEPKDGKVVGNILLQPISLEDKKLFKFVLVKRAENKHIFVFVTHHITADGKSAEALRKATSDLYNQKSDSLQACFDGPVRMGEYLASDAIKDISTEDMDYWGSKLENAEFMHDLQPHKRATSFDDTKVLHLEFTKEESEAIRFFIKEHRVTPFIYLSTMFSSLLSRYTGKESIVLSYPFSVRPRKYEHVFGCFIHTALLSSHIEQSTSLLELLHQRKFDRKQEKCHLHVPLYKIKQAVKNHSGYDGPLSNIMVVETVFSPEEMYLDGLKTVPIECEEMNTEEDMVLVYDCSGETLKVQLHYKQSFVEDWFASQFLSHFRHLVLQGMMSPDVPLSSINLLNDQQWNQQVVEWNQVKTTPLSRQKNVIELFDNQVQTSPPSLAVLFSGQSVTYQALDRRVCTIASSILTSSKGGVKGQAIAVMMNRGIDLLASALAILKLGAIYVPLSPSDPVCRKGHILSDCAAAIILTQSQYKGDLPEGVGIDVCIETNKLSEIDSDIVSEPVDSDSTAYILYTSGSTGKPKGVAITHASLTSRIAWLTDTFGMNNRLLHSINPSFDPSIYELFWPVTTGASIVIASQEKEADTDYIAGLIQKHSVDIATFVPSFLHLFLQRLQGESVLSLKHAICGGEKLSPQLVATFYHKMPKTVLYNAYGPTEATIITTFHSCSSEEVVDTPIGRPIWDTECYVLNKSLMPQPIGVAGDLYIAGSCLSTGYIGHSSDLNESFIDHPFSLENRKMYYSGDRAFYDQEGQLHYVGREDNQVKIRGKRVELAEIENSILACGSVLQVASWLENEKLTVCIVGKASVDEVKAYIHTHLPKHMHPTFLFRVSAFPLTRSGKVDMKQLKKTALFSSSVSQKEKKIVLPRTDTEVRVFSAFKNVLKRDDLAFTDDFFEMGGDSLRSIALSLEIEEKLGIKIMISDVYEHSSARDMSKYLSSGKKVLPFTTMQDDLALIDAIPIFPSHDPILLRESKGIFITGVTGFVGCVFLRSVVRQTQAPIYCLVRDVEAAKKQLASKIKEFSSFEKQCIFIQGDLSQKRFGINLLQWDRLADNVDLIFHLGATVNFIHPYHSLRSANVLSTLQLIQLCSEGQKKTLHYMSTASVCHENAESGRTSISEDSPLEMPMEESNGYIQTKWLADYLVLEARKKGLNAYLYRPGTMIPEVGDPINQLDVVNLFVKGCLQAGSFPKLSLSFWIVTVQYVVDAMIAISKEKYEVYPVFHFTNSHQIETLLDVCQSSNKLGYDCEMVAYQKWREIITYSFKHCSNALFPVQSLFIDPFQGSNASLVEKMEDVTPVLDQKTRRFFEAIGVSSSLVMKTWSTAMLETLEATGFLSDVSTSSLHVDDFYDA